MGDYADEGLIEMFSPEGLREEVDPFTALASSIMGQQVWFTWTSLRSYETHRRIQDATRTRLIERN